MPTKSSRFDNQLKHINYQCKYAHLEAVLWQNFNRKMRLYASASHYSSEVENWTDYRVLWSCENFSIFYLTKQTFRKGARFSTVYWKKKLWRKNVCTANCQLWWWASTKKLTMSLLPNQKRERNECRKWTCLELSGIAVQGWRNINFSGKFWQKLPIQHSIQPSENG